MKLVQTLVVRDEADIVGAQLEYHLNAGVDFVLASDHQSEDGTTEILESYARQGVLRRLEVSGPMQDGAWRTRMARLAATEHGADWVINTDADEFWMPRGAPTLKETLAAVPEPFGIVFALSRHFLPQPGDDTPFAERMTVRVSPPVAINDPASPYRPHLKAAHRADPAVSVSFGSHTVWSARWRALHHWHPADVLHFPFRSLEQWTNKGARRARGDKPLGQYVAALRAKERGRSADRYRSLLVGAEELARGRAAGEPLPPAERAAEPGVVGESVSVRDADIVRLRRSVDGLARRVSALERRRRR
ncbi:MAG TPA: glycosyltransferase family 2 protein [Gaiellaceae bacterium]|nr:glycosyltransferase family 2 protein [Gaiellaceae bacterium]